MRFFKSFIFLAIAAISIMNVLAQNAVCPHREMDFWIGDWEVYSNASGKVIGGNKITSILGGCALKEEWWDVRKFEGTSYTIYSEKHKAWKQMWVDNTGDMTELLGVTQSDRVIFITAPTLSKEGKTVINRMTIIKKSADELHQFGEESTDNMTTWEKKYDFTYKRKKK